MKDSLSLLTKLEVGKEEETRKLIGAVYQELRLLAQKYLSSERANHTLQPTALVHEAYTRLIEQDEFQWKSRNHFFAMAARTMRRVLVDHARKSRAAKRGETALHITLEPEIHHFKPQLMLDTLDEALTELHKMDPRQSQIVELRFFGGLNIKECSEVLNISTRTVNSDWQMAKAWLFGRLNMTDSEGE